MSVTLGRGKGDRKKNNERSGEVRRRSQGNGEWNRIKKKVDISGEGFCFEKESDEERKRGEASTETWKHLYVCEAQKGQKEREG